MTLLSILFILAGLFFAFVAGIGAIRLPDFYCRSHAIGVVDTLGTLVLILGVMFQFGISIITAKLAFILIFIYLANPTITHVLMRAALRSGLEPWTKKVRS
ncbi:MAG: monovalent cation/H(+) antiporter subunit G [Candidatus Omnitrophica bacterium]|nr:monovalent cation/H(+) antiporter subunit G [Candidatus Omnitrophota bacterium]